MIEFDAVTKFHEGKSEPAVSDLSLRIAGGELCVFIGPSGCGKTTSLRLINRLETQSSGVIRVNGVANDAMDVVALRRSIGFMMQNAALFPHRTVAENIATVPRLLGWKAAAIEARVQELTAMLGLPGELLGRYPGQLSGGQQSRVALARALASDPPVVLMDEPFAALDPLIREHLQDELVALQRRLRKTIILVTHDMDEAMRLGDRIAVFEGHGQLAQFDAPAQLLAQPKSDFVRQFVGSDPSLKRLALMKVSALPRSPVAGGQASSPITHPVDGRFTLALNERLQPLAWRSNDGSEAPRLAVVTDEDTLHQALLTILNNAGTAAVRVDTEGRYSGCITCYCLYQALNS
ncbi:MULTISPECIES: ABC transporter ATP-binding protein [unclassified Pseudomonas]|uniref:ABC transporter ATP-binding protein n=1 Tax=unclassified Pseudomonas TaxID=196821 RepID=UPI000BC81310|nr:MULTISPECIES: ATP-binding cassette domain-containing protein [unclassified Pseudomonas]PVZ10329.1 osmoprotectant transport system ATP-binding protein [Pseudomonas sp. URIL14HWK12:I12]PVZ21755.1 osmoprotectant transport system ATP-binding protein [Pseudomonas sp. URIL14HWK12:I10]PVZ31162.1 osmoprotectant transport system ATP-binding protein [Pseudomonas sp. URIL14HWK12:I11]SNZ17917.1 osmoprotectant transport system ATP-binding protein [Pseudomonas sp. URIL14HWK12:I9]